MTLLPTITLRQSITLPNPSLSLNPSPFQPYITAVNKIHLVDICTLWAPFSLRQLLSTSSNFIGCRSSHTHMSTRTLLSRMHVTSYPRVRIRVRALGTIWHGMSWPRYELELGTRWPGSWVHKLTWVQDGKVRVDTWVPSWLETISAEFTFNSPFHSWSIFFTVHHHRVKGCVKSVQKGVMSFPQQSSTCRCWQRICH